MAGEESWDMRGGVDWPSLLDQHSTSDMIDKTMTGTIDGRIYPHGQHSYDTSFDLRRHLMIRTNVYNAIGRTIIKYII